MKVLVHAPGDPRHGVVRHAATVSRLTAVHGVRSDTRQVDLTHAHFTDALYGPDITTACAAFELWAATAPRPLITTLHDVPGADPDRRRDAARRAGYARVAAACDATVVSSEHEAAKVSVLTGRPVEVIELPIEPLPDGATPPSWADRPTIGLLGFVYPGKGHAELIDAAGRQRVRPMVVAAGAASPGHTALAQELAERARDRGVDLIISGHLSDAELAAAADAITVPVAPNRRVSASGSLLAWLSRRRRPITAAGQYSTEIQRRHPGTLNLYASSEDLDTAVASALDEPALTRLLRPPPWPDVGAAHAALYRRVTDRC